MPRIYDFAQVDVFSTTPYLGNPVAVVLDAEGVTDEQMQRLARWTNLSETTFVLPPTIAGADYRLRIFTPSGELPFAGHPTLGSAAAWLDNGGIPADSEVIVQECGAGLVQVRRDGDTLSFAAPPTVRSGPSKTTSWGASRVRSASTGAESSPTSGSTMVPVGPWCSSRPPRKSSRSSPN